MRPWTLLIFFILCFPLEASAEAKSKDLSTRTAKEFSSAIERLVATGTTVSSEQNLSGEELFARALAVLNRFSKSGDFPPYEITTTPGEIRFCIIEPNGDKYCYIYNLRTGTMSIEINYARWYEIDQSARLICENGVCRIVGPFGIELLNCRVIPLSPKVTQYECLVGGQTHTLRVYYECQQLCIEFNGLITCTTLPQDIIDLLRRGIFPFLPKYPADSPSFPAVTEPQPYPESEPNDDVMPPEYDPDVDFCGGWRNPE